MKTMMAKQVSDWVNRRVCAVAVRGRSRGSVRGIAALLVIHALAYTAYGLTPAELQGLMESSTPMTIIDVRAENLYKAGHIPKAINIPARVLPYKKLPDLGFVVVYGGGLGVENMTQLVADLNEKDGIQAEALEGGYAAWEMARGATTRPLGIQPERLNHITYQSLKDLQDDDVVLVDLRKPQADEGTGALSRQGLPVPAEPLTSLSEQFPGRAVVQSPFELSSVANRSRSANGSVQRQGSQPQPVPLMVLIDNGDGTAEKQARLLKANGITRVVILAGGETILERGGQSGLKRLGNGSKRVETDHED